MPFQVERGSRPGTFRLAGELDVAGATELDPLLRTSPEGDLRFDLSELTFMDSTGLRALVRLARDLRQRGASLILEGPAGEVARLLQLVRADTFPGVVVVPDLEP